MPKYTPIILRIYVNKFGYWVVTYSTAPGARMSVTICREGPTQAQVREAAEVTLANINQ